MANKINSEEIPAIAKPAVEKDALELFHPVTSEWFRAVFERPTAPQRQGWPAIARGDSTLILAPTGTGKTLTAFLWCIDRLMLGRRNMEAGAAGVNYEPGCRMIYISPLKALAVDVERNLRSPLAGIAQTARKHGLAVREPEISVRTGDTPQKERSRFRRSPAEILITTPESLYLLLTSESAASLKSVDTVILDEIHAMVPTKRGAHLALSLERLEALTGRRIQRIGLSATQRPLEEVAQFLAGAEAGHRNEMVSAINTRSHGDSPAAKAAETGPAAVLAEEEQEWTGNAQGRTGDAAVRFRPVTIVDASEPKRLELTIEVPVEDMAQLGQPLEMPSGPASQGEKRTSIWSAIHPRLLDLVESRTSTLIFVNNRRTAERLAGALNDLAAERVAAAGGTPGGESIVARAHHGSVAAAQRSEIEELLKAGRIKALVATSSLELGIDMGAVDLVVQIEAPPSVASGLQRIGRAGHQVGAASEGVIFPKYRADLIACAAVTRAMREGQVESTRYLRNPLDVLAQQIVAIVGQPPSTVFEKKKKSKTAEESEEEAIAIPVEELLALVRSAANFAGLSRAAFEGVLDMLAGRYPSDEFAELRPRVTWDRVANTVSARLGAKRLAILNGGTIPDRGLYGVFLSGAESKPVRVGELDEEMVFETHRGDTFILGASTWRVDDITHDRVLVSPAPGEPGKMPFWHGEQAGRPLEFGRRIGAMVRELRQMPRNAAIARLTREHDLAAVAAENLMRYLADQELATVVVPDDRTIVIERVRDELGDWRVCVLTPFGSRVHAPWAMAVSGRLRAAGMVEIETMWADDGFVLRFPETDDPPDVTLLLPEVGEATDLVLRQLGSTALFAAKFREAASRALLLPRRRAAGRTPLWQQRKRSYDLLAVASRFASFPILLEAYRECLRDVFDMPAFLETLRAIQSQTIRVHTVDSRTPSPFAASLLFRYVANYIYDGDAPLAERRAQALSIDQEQLRELMGDADLRELLDLSAIEETEEQLQCLSEQQKAKSMDGVHDLLLRIGDLTLDELHRRCVTVEVANLIERLTRARRVLELRVRGEKRFIAIEDAGKFRDALGIPLPPGIPKAFTETVENPASELIQRYARTHGPFTLAEAAGRFGLPGEQVEGVLRGLMLRGRVVEGGFRPGGVHREWCDAEVLRLIRRKSLAKLRKEVEPVEQQMLARLQTHWQGVLQKRRGLDALLDSIEHLQGAPIAASLVESEMLPARVNHYNSGDLDTLIAAGEVVWCGVEPIGERDGRISLYLAEKQRELRAPQAQLWQLQTELTEKQKHLLELLSQRGAEFFAGLHEAVGGGYPGETVDALWGLVWRGLVTNDSLHALRAYVARPTPSRLNSKPVKRQHNVAAFRSRRTTTPPSAQGRWSLVPPVEQDAAAMTRWSHAIALQLLNRYGVLTRESVQAENLPGGFSAVYDVLKAFEESGRVRRGYFVAGLGATQFALPAAVDLLRSLRSGAEPDKTEMVLLAATDPANPYGTVLKWPVTPVDATDNAETGSRSITRSVGASVILRNGEMVAYLRRANPNIQIFLPQDEPMRGRAARELAQFFADHGQREMRRDETGRRGGMLVTTVNGIPVGEHFIARYLIDAGFQPAPMGFNLRRILLAPGASMFAGGDGTAAVKGVQ